VQVFCDHLWSGRLYFKEVYWRFRASTERTW